jgi:hypothetical protein
MGASFHQIASAAERAFSMGQLAARRARLAAFQHQVDESTHPDDLPPGVL